MALAFALILSSCGGAEKTTTPEASNQTEASAPPNADQNKVMKYEIDTEKSVVNWTGTKFGFYDHTGTLKFSKGSVKVKGSDILSGGLVVDMTSLATTDENYDEENTSDNLIGHLSSPDFFNIKEFKTAQLGFMGNQEANLSIKDKTNKITYKNVRVEESPEGKKLFASTEFNRQDFGVTFKIGEAIANDIVKLDVELLLK